MLEVKESDKLRKGMLTIWIIWGAMIGSLVAYVIAERKKRVRSTHCTSTLHKLAIHTQQKPVLIRC